MRIYIPSLNCYPSAYPALSGQLMSRMIDNADSWSKPADIYPEYLEAGRTRTRNELYNLRELGFLRKDARGYQLCIPAEEARNLFAYKETPTQRQLIADILQKGFVYAHQFLRDGRGDVTQFLRAARGLVDQSVIESELRPTPKAPHINRRIYTFTERAKKNAPVERVEQAKRPLFDAGRLGLTSTNKG